MPGSVKAKARDRFSKGKRPSFLTRQQAVEYERARRNYNRRVDYHVRKWQKQYPGATAEELGRLGVVPWKIGKTVGELENKKEYANLRKLFNYTKTKKYRNKLKSDMKDRLKYVVDEAYFPPPELRQEIDSIINKMSSDDLVRFNYDNAGLIGDVYHAYVENKEMDAVDADQYESRLNEFMTALRKFKKRFP